MFENDDLLRKADCRVLLFGTGVPMRTHGLGVLGLILAFLLLSTGCKHADAAKARTYFAAARAAADGAIADVDFVCKADKTSSPDESNKQTEEHMKHNKELHDALAKAFDDLEDSKPPDAFREQIKKIQVKVGEINLSGAAIIVNCYDQGIDPQKKKQLTDNRSELDTMIRLAEKEL